MEGSDKIKDSEYNLTTKVFQNKLKQAQQALDANDFEQAQEFFREALMVPGKYAERKLTIRHIVKQYTIRVTQQQPPQWDLARHALDLLLYLELHDDQTRALQYDVGLKEAQSWLEKEDIETAFKVFTNLIERVENPDDHRRLKTDISRIVRNYFSQQAAQRQWSLPSQVVDRFKTLHLYADELDEWLETISQIVTIVDQIQTESDQRQRFRIYTYLLIGLVILLAVPGYIIAVIILFSLG